VTESFCGRLFSDLAGHPRNFVSLIYKSTGVNLVVTFEQKMLR
jgi:hypothetical protein